MTYHNSQTRGPNVTTYSNAPSDRCPHPIGSVTSEWPKTCKHPWFSCSADWSFPPGESDWSAQHTKSELVCPAWWIPAKHRITQRDLPSQSRWIPDRNPCGVLRGNRAKRWCTREPVCPLGAAFFWLKTLTYQGFQPPMGQNSGTRSTNWSFSCNKTITLLTPNARNIRLIINKLESANDS